MNYKLGSLFDGSGGFPLAGALCGIALPTALYCLQGVAEALAKPLETEEVIEEWML